MEPSVYYDFFFSTFSHLSLISFFYDFDSSFIIVEWLWGITFERKEQFDGRGAQKNYFFLIWFIFVSIRFISDLFYKKIKSI